jgi:hypothetical protein
MSHSDPKNIIFFLKLIETYLAHRLVDRTASRCCRSHRSLICGSWPASLWSATVLLFLPSVISSDVSPLQFKRRKNSWYSKLDCLHQLKLLIYLALIVVALTVTCTPYWQHHTFFRWPTGLSLLGWTVSQAATSNSSTQQQRHHLSWSVFIDANCCAYSHN